MRAARYPYFATRFAALAHRGGFSPASPSGLENSLRAFRAACDLGFTYLETDVHTTRDRVLVAFHDEELDRVTDAKGRIEHLPWTAVREARIGGREPIPTLSELLDALPDARLNIDLKSGSSIRPLVDTLDAHGAHERVCVASFSDARLAEFRRLTRGRVATAATPREVAVFALAPGLRRRWPLGGQAFQVPVRDEWTRLPVVTRGMVNAAHRRGAVVHVWTINDPDEMERLIDLGVDGLVSDDLLTLKRVLVRRGLWQG